jgi:hypothetical protein
MFLFGRGARLRYSRVDEVCIDVVTEETWLTPHRSCMGSSACATCSRLRWRSDRVQSPALPYGIATAAISSPVYISC